MVRIEPGYLFAKAIVLPWLAGLFRVVPEGTEHIPRSGAGIIAVNHISLFDPLAVAYVIDRNGRHARFLAKAGLFKAPVVGWILRTAKQIRVERGGMQAIASLEHAERAIAEGELVVIFPEGTTTMAPDLTPLRPKTGVARLAMKTGLPIIPCATWGGQWVWGYHLGFRHGFRRRVWVRFGEPIVLDPTVESDDPAGWQAISDRVMDEIAALLEDLQRQQPWTPVEPKKRKPHDRKRPQRTA